MFENLSNVKQAFKNQDLPSLTFNGGMKHPLNIIVLPSVCIGVAIIFTVFIILAVIIDFSNLFVLDKTIKKLDKGL